VTKLEYRRSAYDGRAMGNNSSTAKNCSHPRPNAVIEIPTCQVSPLFDLGVSITGIFLPSRRVGLFEEQFGIGPSAAVGG
jgi:hypothetical protein